MAADTYLTVERLVALSEFPFVTGKPEEKLATFVSRAHIRALDYGPFPTVASLAGDTELQTQFQTEMEMALFLLAEHMVLAQPATPMAAAGFTQQSSGGTNVSRASGGGHSGAVKQGTDIPEDTLVIFRRWSGWGVGPDAEDLMAPISTEVFAETRVHEVGNTNHKVVVIEDDDALTPSLPSTAGRRVQG